MEISQIDQISPIDQISNYIKDYISHQEPPNEPFLEKELFSFSEKEKNIKLKVNGRVIKYVLQLFPHKSIPNPKSRETNSYKQSYGDYPERGKKRIELLTALVNKCWFPQKESAPRILFEELKNDLLPEKKPIDFMIMILEEYLGLLEFSDAVNLFHPESNPDSNLQYPPSPSYSYTDEESMNPFDFSDSISESITSTLTFEANSIEFENLQTKTSQSQNADENISQLIEQVKRLNQVATRLEAVANKAEITTETMSEISSSIKNCNDEANPVGDDDDCDENPLILTQSILNFLTRPKKALEIARELNIDKTKVNKILYALEKVGLLSRNQNQTWIILPELSNENSGIRHNILQFLQVNGQKLASEIGSGINVEKKKVNTILEQLKTLGEVEKNHSEPPVWQIKSLKRSRSEFT
mmetsp:Transcript_2629/g.2614  ORF Transcript_2629/g.2614 Transcript_2629/m.2614 type:complete len:414 (-) Transcript_2629:51-1292(-)